jgi:poly(3-hydroxybutyrate) depolymerase
MKLPYLASVLTVLLACTGAFAAENPRVTVVTKSDRQAGTLALHEVRIETDKGIENVPMAEVTGIEFGKTSDAIRRRGEHEPLTGRVEVAGWKLRRVGGETPLQRQDLRLIVPQAALGQLQKGRIMHGAAANGMTYHVRVPDQYDATVGGPAIILLHGSNTNTAPYVSTVVEQWPEIASKYILIGIDGEQPSDDPGETPRYTYTYVNFAGKSKYKGFPGTDRESPVLVAEVIAEIKQQVRVTKLFLGGHSQGGYLAYVCLMNYPELFAGGFPMSGGMIIQAEPDAFENAQLRARQRQLAIIVVHGRDDEQVLPEMAESAFESLVDGGFPTIRLLLQEKTSHAFMSLPVDQAVRWLEDMTSGQPQALVEVAEKAMQRKDYREASAALARAARADVGGKHAARIKPLRDKVESLATDAARPLTAAMRQRKGDAWVADFVAFRKQFESTESAKPIIARYLELRELHEPMAEKLWFEARRDFGNGSPDTARPKCEEIVTKYYASSFYRYAKRRLEKQP